MIGTPLSMFSNITAAGNEPSVFTGVCGAESGWVPVTASSPTIFVSQIETQRRAQARDIAPILPSPKPEEFTDKDTDKVIFAPCVQNRSVIMRLLSCRRAETLLYLVYGGPLPTLPSGRFTGRIVPF